MAQKQILEDRPVTMETLLDRIQIEDFITRYYYDLSVGKAKELAEYFTEDAAGCRIASTPPGNPASTAEREAISCEPSLGVDVTLR